MLCLKIWQLLCYLFVMFYRLTQINIWNIHESSFSLLPLVFSFIIYNYNCKKNRWNKNKRTPVNFYVIKVICNVVYCVSAVARDNYLHRHSIFLSTPHIISIFSSLIPVPKINEAFVCWCTPIFFFLFLCIIKFKKRKGKRRIK